MRSAHGMQNYRTFVGADFMLYVEGRRLTNEPIEDPGTYDHKYYEAILKTFVPGKNVKIKLIGGKANALDYHDEIITKKINKSYVLIDKDYDGLLYSRFDSKVLLTTFGYSWENDFWTDGLCYTTLGCLTIDDRDAIDKFDVKLRRSVPRLKKISSLSACAHVNGKGLFLPEARSKGISITAHSSFPIKREEFSRVFRGQYKKEGDYCYCTRSVYSAAIKLPHDSIIQGHLYEHLVLTLMSHEYKLATRETTCAPAMVKNVAFSHFLKSPRNYLSVQAIEHYERELLKLV